MRLQFFARPVFALVVICAMHRMASAEYPGGRTGCLCDAGSGGTAFRGVGPLGICDGKTSLEIGDVSHWWNKPPSLECSTFTQVPCLSGECCPFLIPAWFACLRITLDDCETKYWCASTCCASEPFIIEVVGPPGCPGVMQQTFQCGL